VKSQPSEGVAAIPAIMSAETAANLLGVRVTYIAKLCRTGKLRASRVGKTLRIRGVDLLAYMDAQPSHDRSGRALGCEGRPLQLAPPTHRFGRPLPPGDDHSAA